MDLFDKYMMRSSGEKKHQPQGANERRVIAAVDTLQQFDWFKTAFSSMTQEEKPQVWG